MQWRDLDHTRGQVVGRGPSLLPVGWWWVEWKVSPMLGGKAGVGISHEHHLRPRSA